MRHLKHDWQIGTLIRIKDEARRDPSEYRQAAGAIAEALTTRFHKVKNPKADSHPRGLITREGRCLSQ